LANAYKQQVVAMDSWQPKL